MAALVETQPIPLSEERYAQSLRVIHTLGRMIVEEEVLPDIHAGIGREAWRDFISATEENLVTDEEFSERLMFEPFRSHQIIDGHVVDSEGARMLDLVTAGYQSSCEAARSNPDMVVQAERDAGDIQVAEIVDSLDVGEMYAVVSMEPKQQLEEHPEFWRDTLHYREGMAVTQVYYRTSETEMLAGAYSIKHSDKTALRQIFDDYGTHIPDDESENRWIRYGVRKAVDLEVAEQFGAVIRQKHAALVQATSPDISVTELMAANTEITQAYFHNYIVPLAQANYRNSSRPEMVSLAQSLLQSEIQYDADDRRKLIWVANGAPMYDDVSRFMEEQIRYGLVEELRKQVVRIAMPHGESHSMPQSCSTKYGNEAFAQESQQMMDMELRIAANIAAGMHAGRTYGGCAGAGKKQTGPESADMGLQDVFGGNAETRHDDAEDKFGSLTFKCQKGHENTRPRNKLIPKCKVCGIDVSC